MDDHPYRAAEKMLEKSNRSRRLVIARAVMWCSFVFISGGFIGVAADQRANKLHPVFKEVEKIREVEKVVVKEVLPPSVCVDQIRTEDWIANQTYECKHPSQKMDIDFTRSDHPQIVLKCYCVR